VFAITTTDGIFFIRLKVRKNLEVTYFDIILRDTKFKFISSIVELKMDIFLFSEDKTLVIYNKKKK
jgi:hypothetical protein